MHIVHCLTHSAHGGGQAVPYLLIKNLLHSRSELRHTVLLPSAGVYVKRFRDLGVEAIEFPFDALHPANVVRIKSVLRELSPDIVHTHGRGAGAYVRSISKSVLPCKRVHTHHGFHKPEGVIRSIFFSAVEKYLGSKTDISIAVSRSEHNEIEELIGHQKRIVTIPNVVDINEVKALAKEPSSIPIDEGAFHVLMIGRNDRIKNYPLAFQSAAIALAQNDRIRFIFIGIDPLNAEAQRLTTRFGSRVTCIPFLDNPLPILMKSKVLLMTSKREGAPLSILEAFALGKPVIGTNVRGIRDVVIHQSNGVLMTEDPVPIADAIVSLSTDKTRYTALSTGAERYAQRYCNVSQWVDSYVDVYRT